MCFHFPELRKYIWFYHVDKQDFEDVSLNECFKEMQNIFSNKLQISLGDDYVCISMSKRYVANFILLYKNDSRLLMSINKKKNFISFMFKSGRASDIDELWKMRIKAIENILYKKAIYYPFKKTKSLDDVPAYKLYFDIDKNGIYRRNKNVSS